LRGNKIVTVRVSNDLKGVFATEPYQEIQSSAEELNQDIKHNIDAND